VVATAAGRTLGLPQADELVDAVLDVTRSAFGAAACSLAAVDTVTSELVYRASVGAGAADTVGMRLPLGRGIAGYAAASGEVVAVDDVTRDPRFARELAEQTGFVPRSVLAAPVTSGDDVLAVLSVLDRTRPGGTEALDLAGRCARALSGALVLGSATREIGSAVLDALAGELDTERPDVAGTLRGVARSEPDADPESTRIVAALAAARRLGAREREAAARIVEEFVAYASGRRNRR
jgi:GAF domain-containing protein